MTAKALEEASTTEAGEHYILRATRQLAETIQKLLYKGTWTFISRRLGYNGDVPATSTTLLKELQWEAMPVIARTPLGLAEARKLWPKRGAWNDDTVRAVLPPVPAVPLVPPVPPLPAAHAEAHEAPDPHHDDVAAAADMHVAAFGGPPAGAGRGVRLRRKTSAGY